MNIQEANLKTLYTNRMYDIIRTLNHYTFLYDGGQPVISDAEWDNLYFQLVELESKAGFALENSPTQKISFQPVSELKKVKHNHFMLSLEKTKDKKELASFIDNHVVLAMAKMDGLTCSLTYEEGKLVRAETRGDGTEGEDILHNALVITSIPKRINYKEKLIVDGELICSREDFKEFEKDYKNPRNFVAGSARLLNPEITANRKLTFVAWDVIEGYPEENSLRDCLHKLSSLGFTIVPNILQVDSDIQTSIDEVLKISHEKTYPIDGLVFKFDSRSYGQQLGKTEHHFKNALAFKFSDEVCRTKVKDIEWSMGRTGVLTPIAILEPVEIDGTTVERASLHNLSVFNNLDLKYKEQQVDVAKMNMIIPAIVKVYKYESPEGSLLQIPDVCPICGGPVETVHTDNSYSLKCNNPDCSGKLINILDHFCGKKGLDIKGLSKSTLEKLISWGWVKNILDIYTLKDYKNQWMNKAGFGEKSVSKILMAIEESKQIELASFISALGIPLIGVSYAKTIAKNCRTYQQFRDLINQRFNFSIWNGFGIEMSTSILNYDYSLADTLADFFDFNEEVKELDNNKELDKMTVVITGKLNKFKNRAELQNIIEEHGGKVSGSVSAKTSVLINNDNTSTSQKNKQAIDKNIPILTEEEFFEKYLTFLNK